MPFTRFIMDDWVIWAPASPARSGAWSSLGSFRLDERHLLDLARDWLGHRGYRVLKSDESSLVETKRIEIDRTPIEVVVKSPKLGGGFKRWLRLYRPARVVRTLDKTLKLQSIGVACEYPVFAMERRHRGRLLDQLFLAERVPGTTLAAFDLDSISNDARKALLMACGQSLADIERRGWTHFDAKTTNWIVFADANSHVPVLIDCDGMRTYRWRGAGIQRLIRALSQHPAHRQADIEALLSGYQRRLSTADSSIVR